MELDIKCILKEIHSNREANAEEHKALREMVSGQGEMIKEIKEDLRGNSERGIDGLIKIVKRHDKLLRPLELVKRYPKLAVILFFFLFHIFVFFSFKGIDKLLTLI